MITPSVFAGGGGADIGGGNRYELAFKTMILESDYSLRTIDRILKSSPNLLHSIIHENYLILSQKLDDVHTTTIELAKLIRQSQYSCPIKILPSSKFCDEAPTYLHVKKEDFNCAKYNDRHFIGNTFGVIGREEAWTSPALNNRQELFSLAIHEVIQNCLNMKDNEISNLISEFSTKSVMITPVFPMEVDQQNFEFFKFSTISNSLTNQSLNKATCSILPSEYAKISDNPELGGLKTNLILNIPIESPTKLSFEKEVSQFSKTKDVSIQFQTLKECQNMIMSLVEKENSQPKFHLIHNLIENNWEIDF